VFDLIALEQKEEFTICCSDYALNEQDQILWFHPDVGFGWRKSATDTFLFGSRKGGEKRERSMMPGRISVEEDFLVAAFPSQSIQIWDYKKGVIVKEIQDRFACDPM